MDATTFIALALACAPQVHADTTRALVRVESAFNPWAIGVVGGALLRQPVHAAEAVATAETLQRAGWNFSVGLGQINAGNFERLGLTLASAFEPCTNLTAMQAVLVECFERAGKAGADQAIDQAEQAALQRALSCYYSGNFKTGFRQGYVARVLAAAAGGNLPAALSARQRPATSHSFPQPAQPKESP